MTAILHLAVHEFQRRAPKPRKNTAPRRSATRNIRTANEALA